MADSILKDIPDLPAPTAAQFDVNAIARAVADEQYRRQKE